MKRNKSGISLITLVITIIIMIILAGAIILTLTNSGIFDKANDAVSKYSLKEVQSIADLAWAEAFADGARDRDSLQAAVDKALEDNDLDDKYKAVADEKGVTVTEKNQGGNTAGSGVREYTEEGVPIPIGFVVSPYDGSDDLPAENSKDVGLVIYALTPEEIEDEVTDILAIDGKGLTDPKEIHYKSMTTRNQFVWVPVNDFKNDFVRDDFGQENLSYDMVSGTGLYYELVIDEKTNMPSKDVINDNIEKYVTAETLNEATKMYNSVDEYGGFYIARYEAGLDENGLSITMGKDPSGTYISVEDDSGEIVEGYEGAAELARSFYPTNDNTYGVVSTLTYGVQWDRTINWWLELDPEINLEMDIQYISAIPVDAYNPNAMMRGWYNSSEWMPAVEKMPIDSFYEFTTGSTNMAMAYNIYDMGGNVQERTMEFEIDRYGYSKVVSRGGGQCDDYGYAPVYARKLGAAALSSARFPSIVIY